MITRVPGWVAALILGGSAFLLGAAATAEHPQSLPPCQWEDSPGPCFWDAETMGNGLGTDFVLRGGE